MITLPVVLQHKHVSVFPDDEDPNQYYLISNTPRIRMLASEGGDGAEVPVFNGVFWTDKADGSIDSTSGLAGATINFDVNLGIDKELEDEIKTQLKRARIPDERRRQIYKQEQERLTAIAKARGEDDIPKPDIPRVGSIHFGSIMFTEGNVQLLEESAVNGEGPIAWSSAGGPASLIGDNNAAFALRLNADGAAIWYKALQKEAKAFSIRYDLKMQLRLPSLEIRAWAGSSQSLELNRKVDRVWRRTKMGACSSADVERVNVRELTQVFLEEGLVNIEIKKGSSQISDEYVSQLREMAMELIEKKVAEIIKTRVKGMTDEERKNSMLEFVKEEVASFVELRFTQRDVVEWPIAPQGTILNFLEGVPEENRERIYTVVDLSDPIVSTIELPVQINAPWDEAPFVTTVKLDCEYPSANKRYSQIFTAGNTSDVWRFRRPKDDDGVVKYTATVYFRGQSEPYVMPEQTTNGSINIQIGKLGLFDVRFKAHPILNSLSGRKRVEAIEINMTYKDSDHPDHFSSYLMFRTEDTEGKRFEHFIGKPIDAPLEFDVRYFLKSGETITTPKQQYYFAENDRAEIYTSSPFEDTLELGVELAISPDPSLEKVIVEFLYEDEANDFQSSESVVLAAEDDWDSVIARLVQMDKDIQAYRYRYKVLGDGFFSKTNWIEGTGDGIIIPPIFQVTIDVSRLGLGRDYTHGILTLEYADDENDHRVSHEVFMIGEDRVRRYFWYIPRMNASIDSYTYSLILYPEDPNEDIVELNDQRGRGRFLFLRNPN